MTRILIVEDDGDIRGMLARGLEAEGFSVGVAGRVDDALAAARDDAPEAIVLDINLPDGSGHDVCRSLREGGYPGPILFLSARDEVRDRAEGLALGADDYIVKPFVFDELLARLQTHLLRRKASEQPRTVITAGRLILDLTIRQVAFSDATARLTPREAEVLALLMDSANQPVSRGDIFDKLWAGQGGLSLNVVDVYVGYLRTKLSDFVRLGGPVIVTVRGRGFMLDLKGQDFRH
ncbi:two-component system response regulator [Methylobacterium sp. Leaf399]|uniref:response regulator transcription factor n=1 Tax=unclassified Methylobacterium TaxID=2615210 RepID=UPI0006F60879|nr:MULTISPECIES: response regulator transcription factor [unclassified Methylobacterium]KQP51364.1 two-component system response regulator [Methylobacterium sp. Leaf108]KQT07436.1 two-component system response regulator [Methylobacterium sp. Leaf399]KQT77296.1 two-component system response regulator [Methylobacterium sp. Leaf466]